MWDQRYAADEYVYGTEPNDFLREHAAQLPIGKALCLAEGEGRNAVYLAGLGHQVTAVDGSSVGLDKANRLAEQNDVQIETVHEDLASFDAGVAQWDLVVSIFCHLTPTLREQVHQQVMQGLKPGGYFLLEAYTPDQLNYRTGGPPDAAMMMNSESLLKELGGLEILYLEECLRFIQEGVLHTGEGAVVQLLARKPG